MEWVLAIFGGAVGAAIINGIFGLIGKRLDRKAVKADREAEKAVIDCASRGAEIAAVGKRVDALYTASRLQMYDRIKYLGKSYISKGSITAEDLEDIIAMHNCYHTDLGGNGFLDNLMEQVKHLPIVTKY